MTLYFITGNAGKYEEVKEIMPSVVQKDIDLVEIQEIDPNKIISHKLLEAGKTIDGEIMVEDTSLYVNSLNGLPGPLIKWFLKSLGVEGLVQVTSSFKDTTAFAKTIIGYISQNGRIKFFEGEIVGDIVKPRGNKGFGWDSIFQPKGSNKTFGEMELKEKMEFSMRKIATVKLREFLKH